MALGVTSEPPHTYYNPTDTTPWWSPIIVATAALVTLIVPLPHVLIASLFRRKRNWLSLSKIIRGWHVGLVVAIVALGLIGLINRYANDFCTSVLAIEGNQKVLEDFYKNDVEHFEGNSVKYGREAEPYKAYSRCVNGNTQNECWSKLADTDAITYRERIELGVSVGPVCQELLSSLVYEH